MWRHSLLIGYSQLKVVVNSRMEGVLLVFKFVAIKDWLGKISYSLNQTLVKVNNWE